MSWGIVFSVDPSEEGKLIHLPTPTGTSKRHINWLNQDRLFIHYHIMSTPTTKQRWQMLASIKVQLSQAFKTIKFYDNNDYDIDSGGKSYHVGELKRYFTKVVKFPTPYLDGTVMSIMAKHAKRLHYEGKLHLEQLMFLSFWCAEVLPKREQLKPKELQSKKDMATGITQLMKRAVSTLKFANDNLDDWNVKLTAIELIQAHSKGAGIAAAKKRYAAVPKILSAKMMQHFGHKNTKIAESLDVHRNSIGKWLKTKYALLPDLTLQDTITQVRYPICQQLNVHFTVESDYTVHSVRLGKY